MPLTNDLQRGGAIFARKKKKRRFHFAKKYRLASRKGVIELWSDENSCVSEG